MAEIVVLMSPRSYVEKPGGMVEVTYVSFAPPEYLGDYEFTNLFKADDIPYVIQAGFSARGGSILWWKIIITDDKDQATTGDPNEGGGGGGPTPSPTTSADYLFSPYFDTSTIYEGILETSGLLGQDRVFNTRLEDVVRTVAQEVRSKTMHSIGLLFLSGAEPRVEVSKDGPDGKDIEQSGSGE